MKHLQTMPKPTPLIMAADFIALLQQPDGISHSLQHSGTVIQHDVHINGGKIQLPRSQFAKPEDENKNISLDGLTFTGSVTFEKFEHVSLSFRGCNFLGSLSLHHCKGRSVDLLDCKANRIDGHRNMFERLYLNEVAWTHQGDRDANLLVDISGYALSEMLFIEKLAAKELRLKCRHTDEHLTSPAATVDDPLWALQLKLAGVGKIFVSTEVAGRMMEPGSFAQRMGAVA